MDQQDTAQRRVMPPRMAALGSIVVALVLVLAVAAANLQLVHGQEYYQQSVNTKTRTITIKGSRGSIYDRNGLPLAYDAPSYNIEFYRDPSNKTEEDYKNYTAVLRQVIRLVEEGGGKVISTFNLVRDENNEWAFNFGNVSPTVAENRKKNWLTNMFIPSRMRQDPPAVLYAYLKERYGIPQDCDEQETHKLLSIWQEVTQQSYMAYLPTVIAYDVDFNTVAAVTAQSYSLTGITAGESTKRYYPQGELMAHIVGYTGQMTSEEMLAAYTDPKGDYRYSATDIVGLSGVEASMEKTLSGNLYSRNGQRIVEVNNLGKIVSQTVEKQQTNGNSVVLTIDADLQRVAAEALEQNIAETRAYQQQRYLSNQAYYDQLLYEAGGEDRQMQYAQMGACVVIDVRNGEILAMVNYPSYDPNDFIGGISADKYQALLDDPGRPLFNKAIASRAHPGSIFKMIPAFAALCEGVTTLDETIDDQGEYTDHLTEGSTSHGPRCWLRYDLTTHQNQNVIAALKNSCNYYFYEIGYRMGISTLADWASRFGLDELSGIEIGGEAVGQIASQQILYDLSKPADQQTSNDARLTYQKLTGYLTDLYAELGIAIESTRITAAVSQMMSATVESGGTQGAKVREILTDELGLPAAIMTARGVDTYINQELYQLLWTANRTLVASIGQEATMITPIAAARYVAAIANGGYLYEAHVIRQVLSPQGEVISQTQPTLVRDLELPANYVAAIKEGMREVVSGEDGTATSYFSDFEYLYDMAGKTGSAQINEIDIEQTAWFVAFAPYESPEIAVVVYMPNGSAGAHNSITVRAVIEYWLKNHDAAHIEAVPGGNTVQ